MSLWSEIQSQPAVLTTFLTDQVSEVESVAKWMSDKAFDQVVVAARGSSDNAARYAEYLWGSRNEMQVALAAPSLYTLYDSPPRLDGSLVVGLSQSGASPDLLAVLKSARDQGRPTLAITNDEHSALADLAERHIHLAAGPERAVAATKTYTAELIALAALSSALRNEDVPESLGEVPTELQRVLDMSEEITAVASALAARERCIVIGRGYHHATAFEWALKIAELAYLVAHPFSAADFRHGPLALVEPGLDVLAVAADGPLFDDTAELIRAVRRRGARVIAISNRPDCPGDDLIVLPPGLPEWLTPIPAAVAAQIFTYGLTIHRGNDPDRPRAIKKVTRTT